MTNLSVRDLSGGYGNLSVLHEINLGVTAGELLVVLGRNGAGKTSLMSGIAGLLPDVSSGKITLGSTDLTKLSARKRASTGVALIQEGKRIFRKRTVEENLLLGTFALGGWVLRSPQRRSALEEAYERFPVLREKRHDRAGGLSGGQQQMLAIAQALAAKPKVLLLDEPSAGLAPAIRDEVFATASSLRTEGLAVVIVEQLVDVALEVADAVAVLDSGRVVSTGPPDRYRDGELLKEIYLGT